MKSVKQIDYDKIGSRIGNLVKKKNLAYGDSFSKSGECLRQMFPNGISTTQYDYLLVIARILDKLFRIANNADAFGENPFDDIAGYSLLGHGLHESKKNDNTVKYKDKVNRKRTKRSKGKSQRAKSTRRSVPRKR